MMRSCEVMLIMIDVDKLGLPIQQNSRTMIFFLKKSGNEANKSRKHLLKKPSDKIFQEDIHHHFA